MNKEKIGYIETTHCQSGSMILFPAMRRKSAAVPKIWCRKESSSAGVFFICGNISENLP